MTETLELTCGICGRGLVDAQHHVEAFRDRGHTPRAVREIEPHTEIALRMAMTRPTGRDAR